MLCCDVARRNNPEGKMGDDVHLQRAIYESIRSSGGGGSGGSRSSFSSGGSFQHLRSTSRHSGPAWGSNVRSSTRSSTRQKDNSRSKMRDYRNTNALEKEGILPARKTNPR